MGITSDVSMTSIVALLAGTAFVLVDVGVTGAPVLVAASHGIAAADYGTTSGCGTGDTLCDTHHC